MSSARTSSRMLAAAIAALASLLLAPILYAEDGPGLGNLTYSSTELLKPISTIRSVAGTAARGQGSVAMHDGFLLVLYAPDSGQTGGGLSFWNVANPRAPVQIFKRDVADIREPHGFGFSNSYPGHYAVLQSQTGIQFWDFTNHTNPVLLNSMTLPGVSRNSDYADGSWWAFWQAPYVYVGGSGNGLYIVDATDPRAPRLVRQVGTGTWGGFRVGPTYAIGNLLVMSSADVPGYVTMDISEPGNPKLLRSAATDDIYSILVNGDRLLAAGADNNLHHYNIVDPTQFQLVRRTGLGDKGGYLSVQDNFAHVGSSASYKKINLNTGAVVGNVPKTPSSADWDFATVLGNVVMVGNDHAEGSPIIPHQTAPDTTGPSVNMVNPKNNATGQATTSRIGVSFTDGIDLRSVSGSTFIVRPVGGATLAGKYSSQTNIVNFFPNAPLTPGVTYEVVINAGGIKDLVGNGVPSAFTSRFTVAGAVSVSCTLTAARTPVPVNQNVAFAPASTTGTGLQYSWDFGDGQSSAFSTTPTANHTYAAPGHYPVKLTVRNATTTSTCSATQTIHTPPTATAPRNSSTIIHDAGRNRVWAVNSDTNTVTAINAANNTKLFEVAVGQRPETLAQAPDGRIWVANLNSGTISVLNPDTGALSATFTLPRGSRPFGVAFSPDNSFAYVTLQGTGRLLRLSPSTGAVLANVGVGPWPRGVAISADSSRVLVTRFISPATRGEVVEVDAASFTVTRTFALATDTTPDTEENGRGVPNYISSVTIQPDGRRAWVPSKKDNTLRGLFRDGQPLTFESTVRTIVSQIDLVSNAEVASARIDLNDRDLANAVVFTRLGDYAFVSTQGTNEIEVLDAYTRGMVSGITNEPNRAPRGMVLTPNNRLYVNNFISRTVSVYDVSGIVGTTSIDAPKLADISTVATETLSAQALTGKRIFYNADDLRMNRDKYISCASCHLDGGQDGRVMDFTDRGEGLRNTVQLSGRRGMGHGRVHWSANFNEIQDFEHDIRSAFLGTGFMTDAAFNTGTRNQPLGDPKAGVSANLDALAAFVTSLNSVGQSPFRNQDGTLTADAVAGQQIFQQLQCGTCHAGPDFTDSASGVLHNVGTIKPSSGKRLGGPLTGLDTPSLKGVWETAPYLHDGSAATLLDVLTTANASGQHGNTASLSGTQLQQLVAYLQQLDDTQTSTPSTISNLSVADTANAADWSIRSNLQVNDAVYGDRTFTFTAIPGDLLGSAWIRPANDSKAFAGNPLATFSLSAAATVYVALNNTTAIPAWVDASWTDTGTDLTTRESATVARTYSVFRKNFAAGSVALGPWNASSSTYVIIVK